MFKLLLTLFIVKLYPQTCTFKFLFILNLVKDGPWISYWNFLVMSEIFHFFFWCFWYDSIQFYAIMSKCCNNVCGKKSILVSLETFGLKSKRKARNVNKRRSNQDWKKKRLLKCKFFCANKFYWIALLIYFH